MSERSAIVLTAVLVVFVSPAYAALIDRGDGFIYDDVLDITWTQNAYINGPGTWDAQVAWADGYSQTHSVYGTFDNWRLPNMDVNGDNSIVDCATASAADCQDNEYGYLYYQYGISDTSPGIFTNVRNACYWSGTVNTFNSSSAWILCLFNGYQGTSSKGNPRAALAVMDGDIAVLAPSTAYTVDVDERTSVGSLNCLYLASGDAVLIGSNMSSSYSGEYRCYNFIDDIAIVSRSDTWDLVAQTGTNQLDDCVYVSGNNNLCDIFGPVGSSSPAPPFSVSATSGSPIVVVWDNTQTESTNTFVVEGAPPLTVDIDIAPGDPTNTVHPHHDGSASAINGLNDLIPVAVLSSSTAVGDPIDFDATTISAVTVRFGPAEGTFRSYQPGFDQDGDGMNDGLLEFRTGDTGVACTDTEMTITGETNAGVTFAGTDTIDADCNAQCHN